MNAPTSDVNKGLPRVRNAAQTQARILLAAQRMFSVHGYIHAGMRDIAGEAGINVALVARYFGSKEKLFEAALTASLTSQSLHDHPKEEFGCRVVSMFVDNKPEATNPLMMLVQAAADPCAQAVALEVIRSHVLAPMAGWLGEPDGRTRAAEILAVCAGFFTYRNLLPLETFSGTHHPAARRWFERTLQDIVDGGSPAA
ncbi:MAG: TetR family transcriptional regulator [Sphingobium sp.]